MMQTRTMWCRIAVVSVFFVGVSIASATLTIGPPPHNGWASGAESYIPSAGQDNAGSGQTFVTPSSSQNLELTGFSAYLLGQPYYKWGEITFGLYEWSGAEIGSGDTSDVSSNIGDLLFTLDTSTEGKGRLYSGSGGNWTGNNDNDSWMFRDISSTHVLPELTPDTMYYWEIRAVAGLDLTSIQSLWGTPDGGASSGDWTSGQHFQRKADGSLYLAGPLYGMHGHDSSFRMEFEEVPEPATALLLVFSAGSLLLRRRKG